MMKTKQDVYREIKKVLKGFVFEENNNSTKRKILSKTAKILAEAVKSKIYTNTKVVYKTDNNKIMLDLWTKTRQGPDCLLTQFIIQAV